MPPRRTRKTGGKILLISGLTSASSASSVVDRSNSMSDFNIRSETLNVEQIMEQIRSRIREKRGVDYTEQQIRELAAVKLEKVLDPRSVRSDLLEQFRKAQPPDAALDVPNFSFESSTLFDSHRAI